MTEDVTWPCIEWCVVAPGIFASSDGRLLVHDGDEILILPAPAAEIWKSHNAREAVSAP